MIDDYQPLAFGKAWGNDADYIAITRKLGDMMSITNSPQEIALKMREIIDEDLSKPPKSKKIKNKNKK
jgi:hypothetical protein